MAPQVSDIIRCAGPYSRIYQVSDMCIARCHSGRMRHPYVVCRAHSRWNICAVRDVYIVGIVVGLTHIPGSLSLPEQSCYMQSWAAAESRRRDT